MANLPRLGSGSTLALTDAGLRQAVTSAKRFNAPVMITHGGQGPGLSRFNNEAAAGSRLRQIAQAAYG